jgi:1-deoxy-D-xylulose 5-phosphate reductoisomerase
MCQYEDKWAAYLEAVKLTYKDMLKVFKNANTGKIQVASHVFRVTAVSGASLFPVDNEHNNCFVAIDPSARTATVWYSAFVPFW